MNGLATPWPILPFIDDKFSFVPWFRSFHVPEDATPLCIAGAELGAHKETGTAFEKVARSTTVA